MEALNSATGTPRSVLHHAKGTAIHRELRELAEEVGKLADLVVLEDDPRAVEPNAISDIQVSETWMDGNRVF